MPPTSAAAASTSLRTSTIATPVFSACSFMRFRYGCWQGRRESNPQPAVLETAALPIELLPCRYRPYFSTFDTTPAPTVRPPSRIANRRPSSMAIGAISSTTILMLSPGMTISTPAGSSMLPVTSVVRK